MLLHLLVPGYFKGADLHKYGHLKVRKLLNEHCDTSGFSNLSPVVCLYSSVGSLHEKFVTEELNASFCAHKPTAAPITISSKNALSKPILVWPTKACVNASLMGVAGAGHYCFSSKNNKPFLKSMYHQYIPHPNYRSQLLSHAKMYTRYEKKNSNDNSMALAYCFLTSSNLSKAAHGSCM